MKLIVGSDHAGLDLKTYFLQHLKALHPKIEIIDVGAFDKNSVDYPDYADLVCKQVQSENERGLLICGSGQGMAIRANKHSHIRAALCWDLTTAKLCREHNNANVLCVGSRLIPFGTAVEILDIFLSTSFAGSRHANRVLKLSKPC